MNVVPEEFRPLMWSYDFDHIDAARDKTAIVVQAINYGTLAHWRWLVENYGRDSVREILGTIPATTLRPRARRLAALIFSVDRFNYAPRGTH
jgi:hypothetical protein